MAGDDPMEETMALPSASTDVERVAAPVRSCSSSADEFTLTVNKSEHGLGLYFAKAHNADDDTPRDHLVVDGFVDDAVTPEMTLALAIGDVLVGVNGVRCSDLDVLEVVELLRSTAIGANTLTFRRPPATESITSDHGSPRGESVDKESSDRRGDTTSSLIKESLFGAIRKVKSRIKAEIEGDEQEMLRQEEEYRQYEKKWLEEFDRLKQEQQTKWDTCTYMADDFCGLLYHSSDRQQQEYLEREYPTLMETWKDLDLRSNALRINPNWPAARTAFTNPIEYPAAAQPSNIAASCSKLAISMPVIESTPQLFEVLDSLRFEFMWFREQVAELSRKLEEMCIYSCTDLRCAIDDPSVRFDRLIQSHSYPRVTKTICNHLHEQALQREKASESMANLCMEQLRVNNPPPPPPSRAVPPAA
ncbi:TPA: hypothetical protein N0F65_012270 [Lagenidium giganteum]|uniref:PDZ domain-containing protein n=1 Tax=Lagenidium giganteum TaxID=4803 RepID=A0AAV2ZD74_9STRA|nr:TPA: hypothetical protein N0F65_012270 [Lagenidium giganteum]